MIVGIHHVQLAMPPGGEKEAVRFYGEVLGLGSVPKPPELEQRGGCWFRSDDAASTGAVEVHLGVEPGFTTAQTAHPAFLVDDLDGVRERVEAAGFPVNSDMSIPGVARFHTSDPFGNRVEFQQR